MFCVHPTALDQTPNFPLLPASLQCSQLAAAFIGTHRSGQSEPNRTWITTAADRESPWHVFHRQNAKTVFSCRALNSNYCGQRQSQNLGQRSQEQRPVRALVPRAAVFLASGKELSLEETVREAASADDRPNPRCCSLQSRNRQVPVRMEPQPSPLDSEVFCDVSL